MRALLFSAVIASVFNLPHVIAQQPQNPMASLTVHVIDDHGNPVAGADAGATFVRFDLGKGGAEYVKAHGLTAKDGNSISTGETMSGEVHYGATKQGYYK